MKNIKYIIYEDGGQFVAQCLNVNVATQGDTYEEAVRNIQEALELYFEDNEDGGYIPIHAVTLAEHNLNA